MDELLAGDPRTVGPYTVLGRLGQGGMGIVYLAAAPDGTRVALKLIHARMDADPGFRRRFAREVAAAQRVAKFCTAPVLDAEVTGPTPYLVTEYVEGPSLEQAVSRSGPLRGSALDGLAVSVATALRAIHGAGVVHRDLKPSNVLLSQVGPKVIDFGIAHMEGGELSSMIVGTPAYMSPEQVSGGRIGPSSDIFSWGCVLAFAAGGDSPFGGGSVPDILMRIVTHEPDLSRLTGPLHDLVAAALAKDPAARPTADDLINALSAVSPPLHQDGPPLSSPHATGPMPGSAVPGHTAPGQKSGRRGPRKGMLVGAAVAVVALGATATALALNQKGATPDPTRAAQSQPAGATKAQPSSATTQRGNPLRADGVTMVAPPEPGATWQAGAWAKERPQDAEAMRRLAAVPYGIWLNDPDVRAKVAEALRVGKNAGGVPVFVTDYIPDGECLPRGAKDRESYLSWTKQVADQIGENPAVVILEPDSLAKPPGTKECARPGSEQERAKLVSDALDVYKRQPKIAVYLDGAQVDWPDMTDMTRRLVSAGVARADGFFLNVQSFARTDATIRYGTRLSTCVHQLQQGSQDCRQHEVGDPKTLPHFVVDTSRNGQGGWKPPAKYKDPQTWCNPPGRGLGPRPTTETGEDLVDAYLWINRAGTSNGHCRRGTTGDQDPERGVVSPAAGLWWGDLALERVKRADPALR